MVTAMNMKMLPAELFVVITNQKISDSMQTASDGIVNPTPPAAPEPPVFIPPIPPEPAVFQSETFSPPEVHTAVPPIINSVLAPPARLRAKPRMYEILANAAAARANIAQSHTPVHASSARYHLCTVTDKSYLVKVIAQYRSLERTASDFHIFVCCTDDEAYRVLSALRLPRCTALTLADLKDGELYTLQRERKANEFCWTLKSYLMLHLVQEYGFDRLIYCDGDIGFMGNLDLLYQDWGDSSIYLCTQRDVDWVERKYGKYQAGILGVKNNDTGLSMLRWWRDKCREWCFNYEDNGRLGDQKYLDDVPGLFGDVKISWNRGINAAPWNTIYNNNYPVNASGGSVTIDGQPLVAYHFACIDIYDDQHFDLWNLGNITVQPVVRKAIYVPYLKMLREAMATVNTLVPAFTPHLKGLNFDNAKTPFIYSEKNLQLLEWNNEYAFCTISSRTYVARTLALYSSIRRFMSNFHIWICCADDTAYAILSRFALENTTLLHVRDVETPEILATRPSKTIAEYCWTLKPALCSYVFSHYNVNRLLYCDSDIYFFSHPHPIYELWQYYDTLLNRQLGTPELENKYGMYQAGMIGFSKTAESLKILQWWLHKCTEWCYDDHSNDKRWGDQKYLQWIPDLFESIRVNDRYGLVAAPWNIVMNNTKGLQVSRAGSDVYLGSEKLVAYHFGSINMLSESSFDLWKLEPLGFDNRILEYIYTPYLKHLSAICSTIAAKGLGTSMLFADTRQVYNPFAISAPKEAENVQLMFADR